MHTRIELSSCKTSKWTGGTSTEMFIYPENSTVEDRNFDFRISSANVALEKSDFSSFSGFNRFLLILKGELEILHENQYSKRLKTFDSDSFSGSWKTSSIGKVMDFNIIYKEGTMCVPTFRKCKTCSIRKKSPFHFILLLDNNSQFKQFDLIKIDAELDLEINGLSHILEFTLKPEFDY